MNKPAWEWIDNEGYVTLKLVGSFDEPRVRQLEEERREKFSAREAIDWIIDCQELSDLAASLTRNLLQLSRELKSSNKKLRLILLPDDIKKGILRDGLDEALPSCPTLREALIDFGITSNKKAIDVNFINPFLIGTVNALQIQANIKAVPGKAYRQSDSSAPLMGDISGIIGLVSDTFTGSVVISFPASTFLKIISSMLGETFTEITKDIEDGAGELTNIIFGQAKVILNEKGYALKTAIPSVVSGKDHKVASLSHGPRVVVPFGSDAGDFCVEICVSG